MTSMLQLFVWSIVRFWENAQQPSVYVWEPASRRACRGYYGQPYASAAGYPEQNMRAAVNR